MKEIIELIIAFLVIMSILVGFLLITSTTGTTHLYNLPSSIVQAFAYDTEDLLSGHDLYDLEHPENIFNGLNELYPELHYRIKISSIYIENQENIIYLNNSDNRYLWPPVMDRYTVKFTVCPPEPANVTLIYVVARREGDQELIKEGPETISSGCGSISIDLREHPGLFGGQHVIAIAVMETQDSTYVAYELNRSDNQYIEAYFAFTENGLRVMIPREAPDGETIEHKQDESAYMIILREDGTIDNITIQLKYQRETDDYLFYDAYYNNNKVWHVDGRVLAIVPMNPQLLITPSNYNIIALPFPGAEEGFEIVYGATPPNDFPVSTYQYITYINGVPALVTVEVWRASA